jgi:hypothetical protein
MMTANKRTNDLEMTTITSLKPTPASTKDESVNVTANGCIDKENTPLLPNANHRSIGKDNNDADGVVGQSISSKNKASTATTTAVAATTNETTTPTVSKSVLSRPRAAVAKEISKQVLRHKLQKLRHIVLKGVISEDYLDKAIFHPKLLEMFDPQTVVYNGGVANIKEWKISCYLEVMEGGVPCTNPHLKLLDVFLPLLETCDDLFLLWYKQQHACNRRRKNNNNNNQTEKMKLRRKKNTCKRLMTFVTRYTPAPGEQALLKHIDGAGKVDGSCVVALPFDKWSTPVAEAVNSWYGHGGGLTFWDGREPVPEEDEEHNETEHQTETDNDILQQPQQLQRPRRKQRFRPKEIHYETRSGDVAFIDRAVWHQADPITKGTRWALVIFYKVTEEDDDEHEIEIKTNESDSGDAKTNEDKRKE